MIFEVMLVIYVSLVMLVSMVYFTDEVAINNQAIYLRNKIINQIDVHGGYTEELENKIILELEKFDKDIILEISKKGQLNFGESVTVKVTIDHQRTIPVLNIDKKIIYSSEGVFYNANP